jgi:thymidylate synthase (FAD)
MKIIKQSCSWEQKPPQDTLQILERAGRTCYKSECLITDDSAKKFIQTIKDKNHASVLEHISASVRFITDRGVTHELVRHRLASFSQESTRYCNYQKDKFGNEIAVILPKRFYEIYEFLCSDTAEQLTGEQWNLCARYENWKTGCLDAERNYFAALEYGDTAQEARDLLPNSLKTEIVTSTNLREWIHIFNLRTSKAAHPQMRDLMLGCLKMFQEAVPVLFDDIAKQ